MDSLEQVVKQKAVELGFHLVGITSAEPFELAEARMLAWLAREYQAGMAWMNEARTRLACRPRELLPGARSIIVVGVSYVTEAGPESPAGAGSGRASPTGRLARYAWGEDYHEVIRRRLWELVGFLEARLGRRPRARVLVDSSPFPDREAAARAGLGFYGKNTTLLTPLGSFVFLGAVLSDVELTPDRPQVKNCGQCRLCLDACPTGALVAPYQLDARRCIAYLTIEERGSLPVELRPTLGDHLFGCDLCQEVCPWNRRVPVVGWVEFRPRADVGPRPELVPLLQLDEEAFRRRFRGSPVRRAKRSGFVRNVAVALGNQGDRRAVPALARALSDPEPLVRGHAAWALGRLGGARARRALEAALGRESEPGVAGEIQAALAALARAKPSAAKSRAGERDGQAHSAARAGHALAAGPMGRSGAGRESAARGGGEG